MTTSPQLRGTEWHVWDLHVHTPSSIVQSYGGDSDAVWERYIAALADLPKDVRVIGINDYWFLDGYRRVRAAKEAGLLPNLDEVFPVIELRLDHFGGTNNTLSRANLHVIFDPDLDPDVIQSQFLASVTASYSLGQGVENTWNGVVTRESLSELGRQIKASAPPEVEKTFGSDLEAGFNNLNVSLNTVLTAINDNSFIRGRAILALGKTEWSDIKWQKGSIAAKRNLITAAHVLFTAFEDPSRWQKQQDELRAAGVNHKVLDCSDAHTWPEQTGVKERLGNCWTWMNTSPSFAGLLHAIEEFDQRVYVGLEPPALSMNRSRPEEFIDAVAITPKDPKRSRAFDYALPLNPGFVAIVGNKGQGKSALLDCIALAGNSSRFDEFAFLTPKRFLSAANKNGRAFEVELTWSSGATRTASFGDAHDRGSPVRVEYLPQRYVERVCTVDADSDVGHEFERELREVLFTHIPDDLRAGERTFDSLLGETTEGARSKTERSREDLRREIDRYLELWDFQAANPEVDIKRQLRAKEVEIEAATADLDAAMGNLEAMDGGSEESATSKALRAASESAQKELELAQEQRASALQALGLLARSGSDLTDFRARAESIGADANALNTQWAATLRGTADLEGSEAWLGALLTRARSIPAEIQQSQEALLSIVRRIHQDLEAERVAVTDLYKPAAEYIDKQAVVKNAGLAFRAELTVGPHLGELAQSVDGRKSPELVSWLLELTPRIEVDDIDALIDHLREGLARTAHDRGDVGGAERHPAAGLRSSVEASEFLYELLDLSWIDVRFGLTGNGMPLSSLSPGQRGLVLTLFYLIVDLRTTPLLLDQPEENLDNETITTLLVPAIQAARARRQTIIVTHNANLAVVGDADQIVHCSVEDGIFSVVSGSISELGIARSAVDVLEGTKPAFDRRRHKYDAFPSL